MQTGDLPGTDEFITRCERVRAWNYVVRAEAQARLAPPIEPAGSAELGSARVWFSGSQARVHLLDETCLDPLPAIEAWLAERQLDALLDVLPVVACRKVTAALAERGYHRQLIASPAPGYSRTGRPRAKRSAAFRLTVA